MLPFGVTQIEQYRALQQNAAKLHLPHFPLATKLLSERKLTKSNRQISDCLSDRLSRRDFANVSAQNMGCLAQKKEAVLAKWAPTSNRFWVKNRSYTKQTTKPCLTGTRTHVRASLNSTKIAQDFAALSLKTRSVCCGNCGTRGGTHCGTHCRILCGKRRVFCNAIAHFYPVLTKI